MVKIFIENKTNWATQSIRKFFTPIVEHEGLTDAPLVLKVTNPRKRNLGHAYYGTVRDYDFKLFAKRGWHYSITMRIPLMDCNDLVKRKLVSVMAHEIAHCRNVRHKDMIDSNKYDTSWFPNDLFLTPKIVCEKVPRNLKRERYFKAKKKLVEVESKLKRYSNLSKKYKKKIKYYEKEFLK